MMKERHPGQSFLEFALILPIMILVVIGVFDLGRIYFSTITLTSAAREGARYLAAYPEDIGSTPAYSNTKSVTILEARNSGITILAEDIRIECNDTDVDKCCDGGSAVHVEVSHDFDLILGWLLPSPITLTRAAEMVVP